MVKTAPYRDSRCLARLDLDTRMRESGPFPFHSPAWATDPRMGRIVICSWCREQVYETHQVARETDGIQRHVWVRLYVIEEVPW